MERGDIVSGVVVPLIVVASALSWLSSCRRDWHSCDFWA